MVAGPQDMYRDLQSIFVDCWFVSRSAILDDNMTDMPLAKELGVLLRWFEPLFSGYMYNTTNAEKGSSTGQYSNRI